MLKHLDLTHFKGWREASIDFGRITGLFGTNSSGKTSIIQFLMLLKQTKEAVDRALTLELGSPYAILGSYQDFIYNHDERADLKWGLTWEHSEEISLIDPSGKRTDAFAKGRLVSSESVVSSEKGAPKARSLAYRFGDHSFRLAPKGGDATAFDLTAEGDFKFVRTTGRPWTLPGPVKSYAFPDQVRTYYQNSEFLALLVSAFEKQMDRIFYLGPLREFPKREYAWTRSRPSDVGQRGERVIEAILAATERGERQNFTPKAKRRPFQEIIALRLQEMGLVDSFSVKEIFPGSGLYQAKVSVRSGAPEVLLTDVGFGVSQVLPVITLLHYVDSGSTVILEQPEIHLHPSAQAGLADAIVNVAKHREVQIVVESHSEHFLLRMQRRIAEEEIEADDVKLYFCDQIKGVSKLVKLGIDTYGNIENWPDNFFGNAFAETTEAQKARIRRRRPTS
jgi:predicted ATPase